MKALLGRKPAGKDRACTIPGSASIHAGPKTSLRWMKSEPNIARHTDGASVGT